MIHTTTAQRTALNALYTTFQEQLNECSVLYAELSRNGETVTLDGTFDSFDLRAIADQLDAYSAARDLILKEQP